MAVASEFFEEKIEFAAVAVGAGELEIGDLKSARETGFALAGLRMELVGGYQGVALRW